MSKISNELRLFGQSCLLAFGAVTPVATQADTNRIVVISGFNDSTEKMEWDENPNVSWPDVCSRARDYMNQALPPIQMGVSRVEQEVAGVVQGASQAELAVVNQARAVANEANLPSASQALEAGAQAISRELERCEEGNGPTTVDSSFTVIYSSCSMLMMSQHNSSFLQWTVPPGAPRPEMTAYDAISNKFLSAPFQILLPEQYEQLKGTTKLKDVSGGLSGELEFDIEYVDLGTQMRSAEYLVQALGAATNVEHRTVTASNFGFTYKGDISPFAAVPGLGDIPMAKMTSIASGIVSPDVPGTDVMQQFYNNFQSNVQPLSGMASVMSGMIQQMSHIASMGMPLTMEQTIKSKVMGFGPSSESSFELTRVGVLGPIPTEQLPCGPIDAPPGAEEYDLEREFQEMGLGTNGTTREQQAQMDDGMAAMNAAMEDLSPEHREMMEQFGLAPQIKPKQSEAGTGATDAAPDDSIEAIQDSLERLGYETGDSRGTLSLETIVAISEFQSDHDLPLTGEIDRQLAAALRSELDRRF